MENTNSVLFSHNKVWITFYPAVGSRQSAVKIELLNLKKTTEYNENNIVKSVFLCFPFVIATLRVVNISVRKGETECTAALPRKMSATQLLCIYLTHFIISK